MQSILFTQLNQEDQLNRTTTPMMVSLTQSPDEETREMMIQRHTKFLSLPEKVKDKLASVGISQKIQAIGQKYGFELLRLANITRLIREYYFGEVRFEDFAAEIEKRMGVSLLTAQEITRYIKSEIIDWDPWVEFLATLPKISIREIIANHPKIADMEITDGYLEIKNSPDLEDPTIKNWIHDYVLHLGQANRSQMDRTQYLFHSENGKNLSSPDREKLGIILKSFDENTPLPVDIENNEIIFDNEQRSKINSPTTVIKDQGSMTNVSRPLNIANAHQAPAKQESFIKPYSPVQQPPRQIPRPTPTPIQAVPTQSFTRPNIADRPQSLAQTPPTAKIQYRATTSDPEINKYFNTPDSSEIPEIKIHSMTEYNEAKIAPLHNIQSTAPPTSPQPSPYQGEGVARPQHRIIEPFPERFGEPRLDGNIVDLSANNDQ